jgi:hypothetical protein
VPHFAFPPSAIIKRHRLQQRRGVRAGLAVISI